MAEYSKKDQFTILVNVNKRQPPFQISTPLFLTVTSTDTVKEIKDRLSGVLKLYPDDQTISFGRKVLEDALPLSYYSIQQNSTLDVVSHGFHLMIHYSHSAPLNIKAQPYYTIAKIKQSITDLKDIPNEKLRLLCKGIEMNTDSNTLYDYGVKWGAHIQLLLRDDPFPILLHIPSGITSELSVQAEHTVKDLKRMICDKYGIRMEQQRLLFKGKKLKNNRCMSYYNITRGATVRLTATQQQGRYPLLSLPFNISIQDKKHKIDIKLEVTQLETIQHIKERIAHEVKAYPEHLVLEYDDKEIANECTLFDCRVKHQQSLTLVSNNYQINIILSHPHVFCVVVRAHNTVRYVKCAIIMCKGIQYSFALRFKGRELDDDDVLYDCGIKPQSSLELKGQPKKIIIYLRKEGGTTCTLRVRTTVTIGAVKKKMGMNPDKYLWLFRTKLLSDDQCSLYSCGLANDSVIDIIPYNLLYEVLAMDCSATPSKNGQSALKDDDCKNTDTTDDIVVLNTDTSHHTTPQAPPDPPASMLDAWLLQLQQHLNAFDGIYNGNVVTHAFEEQIETVQASINVIAKRVTAVKEKVSAKKEKKASSLPPSFSADDFEPVLPWPMTEDAEAELSSDFEDFLDSIPYATETPNDVDTKDIDHIVSNLRPDAQEFIYAPNIVVNIQAHQQQYVGQGVGAHASYPIPPIEMGYYKVQPIFEEDEQT
eukprot:252153_1